MEQFAWYEIIIGIIVFSAIIMGILVAFSVDKDKKSPKVSNDNPKVSNNPKECPKDGKSKHFNYFNRGYKTWVDNYLK